MGKDASQMVLMQGEISEKQRGEKFAVNVTTYMKLKIKDWALLTDIDLLHRIRTLGSTLLVVQATGNDFVTACINHHQSKKYTTEVIRS